MGDLAPFTRPSSGAISPIFVSVKQAAEALNLHLSSVYELLDQGVIDSRYHGRRRLVLVESLHEYARSLPSVPESA